MANKKMNELQNATVITDADYLIGYFANSGAASRYTLEIIRDAIIDPHNQDDNAHDDIRDLITQADSALADHVSNTENPHEVTLSQAAAQQGSDDTVIGGSIYEGTDANANKLVTQAEATAIAETAVQGAPMYMGQLKYGADTVDSMDNITGMVADDICGVQETQLSYQWDGSAWTAQSHGNDVVGQYYDILFWYGTWNGTAHAGDVSARITCADAVTPVWNLIVYDDKIMDSEITTAKLADGAVTTAKLANSAVTAVKLANSAVTNAKLADVSVTDSKIGNRTLTDGSASGSLISTSTPQYLTAWLQGIRNNLKYLLNNQVYNMAVKELSDDTNSIKVDDMPQSIYWMLELTKETSSSRTIEIHQERKDIIFYLQIYNKIGNEITLQIKCPEKQRRQSEEPLKIKPGYSIELSYILIGDIVTITSSENLKTYEDL
jgi:hypothetical protein